MTLIVAVSRADEFALISADSMVFHGEHDGAWLPADNEQERGKVRRITDRVLMACAGDSFLARDFTRRLATRVAGDDDLDACHRIAGDVVRELWDDDFPGTIAFNDRSWRRDSIKDEQRLGVLMAGFRPVDSGIAAYRSGEREPDPIFTDASRFQIQLAAPYGVDTADVLQYRALDVNNLERDLSLEGAALRAFSAHHFVGTHYDDRTTPDVNFAVIVRNPDTDTYMLLERSVDWADVNGFWVFYDELAELAHPRFKAARRADARRLLQQQAAV